MDKIGNYVLVEVYVDNGIQSFRTTTNASIIKVATSHLFNISHTRTINNNVKFPIGLAKY